MSKIQCQTPSQRPITTEKRCQSWHFNHIKKCMYIFIDVIKLLNLGKKKKPKQINKTITYPNASTWKSIKTFEHSGGACKRKLSIESTFKLNFKQPQHASPNGWSMMQWHLQKTTDFHYWPISVHLLDPGFGILICGKH